jgi:apolipoprotein N-acyltransferase
MAGALAVAALLFSGAIQAAISAPASWIWLHPFSWVPALLVLSRLRGLRAFAAGWLVGAAANAAIFAWLVHTIGTFTQLGSAAGVAALGLFAAAQGLYAGVFAWGLAPIRRAAGRAWPVAVAAWFTACEFLAPQFFPYFQGVAWYVEPRVFLAAATTGVAGISFLVLLANAVVLQAIEVARARRGGANLAGNAIGCAALLALALLLASRQDARVTAAERTAAPLRVALVQPGGDPHARPVRSTRDARERADALAEQARDAIASDRGIEVVVLPEKAIEYEPSRTWNRAVRELAPAFGVEIWTGASASDRGDPERPRFFNSAYRIRPDGVASPRYDKNVLVPFGEYMPFGDTFASLSASIGRTPFAAGAGLPLHDAGATRFAFLICYEAILPRYVREPIARGANLLVNLTYDGWFGDGAEPAQHLMLVAVQAAQLGVPVLRATTTGISALIDARGRVLARTELFERVVLTGDVHPLRAPGLYAAWGDWFAWSCVAVSAALLRCARGQRPTSRRISTGPSANSTAAGSISRTR